VAIKSTNELRALLHMALARTESEPDAQGWKTVASALGQSVRYAEKRWREDPHCTECDGNGYHVSDCPRARLVRP